MPIESFHQGLELRSPSIVGPTSPYEINNMDQGEIVDSMPTPPQGDNQTAAWYDTDL